MPVVPTVGVQCLNDTWNDNCFNLVIVRVDDPGGGVITSCGALPTVRKEGRFTLGSGHMRVRRGSRAGTVSDHVLIVV